MNVEKIIDGKKIAQDLKNQLKQEIGFFSQKYHYRPCLAVILLGDNPASKLYIKNKIFACLEVGIELAEFYFKASLTEIELITVIKKLNQDPKINGILVQLPLPEHIDTTKIINLIDPSKDVDGFTANNFGKLVTNQDCFIPCTPQGCLSLVKTVISDLSGIQAVILGRSNIVGRPMSHILLQENATVTIAHSFSKNLPEICCNADLLIVAVGSSKLVKASWIKKNAVIIDVGINYDLNGKISGDVDFVSVIDKVSAITPVPGGVGPMTILSLLKNTLKAAKLQLNYEPI